MALYNMKDKTKKKDGSPETSAANFIAAESGQPGDVLPTIGVRKKKRRRWPVVVIVAVAVLALVLVLPRMLGLKRQALTSGALATQTVARGDITVTLSGSGTLQPADSYTITSLISGDILTAPFEEGDTVQKDAVLYTVDSTDVQGNYEQAVNAVGQAQSAYDSALKQLEDLRVKAGGAGTVAQLNVKTGDTVTAGQTIGVVRDASVMTLKIPFQRDYAQTLSVGSKATIYVGNNTYDGVISDIGTVDTVPANGVIARIVTFELKNPGAFTSSQQAYAQIGSNSGIGSGTLAYKYEGNLVAPVAGKVTKIVSPEGTHAVKDQVVIILQSDAVDQQVQRAKDALDDAKSSMNTQRNRVGDYTITSPISGTIVEKDIKAGDTMKANSKLCTVFDLSYLQLVLNVDELDIKKVAPGQTVSIKADAAPGETYSGVVTKININGTTLNGVTSYPVTIKIDNANGLLPGMNVDATITVQQMTDVLTVPIGSVVRNNFVYVKSDNADPKQQPPGTPAGFVPKEVTLGPSNDKDIVITGGLNEGDVVAVMDNTPSSYDMNPFMAENRVERAENGGSSQNQSGGGNNNGNNNGNNGSSEDAGAAVGEE